MPQHTPMRQQIITIDLTAFNQHGNRLDQFSSLLFVPPSSLPLKFSRKTESARRFDFILTKIRQPLFLCSHRSLTGKFQDLRATYRELFTTLTELLDMLLLCIAQRAP